MAWGFSFCRIVAECSGEEPGQTHVLLPFKSCIVLAVSVVGFPNEHWLAYQKYPVSAKQIRDGLGEAVRLGSLKNSEPVRYVVRGCPKSGNLNAFVLYSFLLITQNLFEEKHMAKTHRKKDISTQVGNRLGSNKADGKSAINAVLESIKDILLRGDRVVLTGFGTFEIRTVRDHRVQPVQGGTGETIEIPAHRRVAFIAGADLRSSVRSKR